MMKYEIKYSYGGSDGYWDCDDSITLQAPSIQEVIRNFHDYCRILDRSIKSIKSVVLVED